LPLLPAIKKLMDEVMQPPSFDAGGDTGEPLGARPKLLAARRRLRCLPQAWPASAS
jgi:hypothetical protein